VTDERPVPLISVVIPNFNYARYVRQAVDSVLNQTYPAVEVIVVDDGSTDDSIAALESYGGRIKLLRQKNGGVHTARNAGIKASAGVFVAFLDADDVWKPAKLERQAELFADPRVGLVHCGITYVDIKEKWLSTATNGLRGSVLKDLVLRNIGVVGPGSTALVRRECFERVGMFDGGLAPSEDYEFCVRVACHYEFEFVPEPLVLYRQHPVSASRNLAKFEQSSVAVLCRIFSNPAAAEVFPYKRHAFGATYRILSGVFYQDGRRAKAIWYGLRALAAWPPSVTYFMRKLLARKAATEENVSS